MIEQPMPRAAVAYQTADKWRGWILAAHGHGPEWRRVFDIGPDDSEQIWRGDRRRRAGCAGFDGPPVREITAFDRVELLEPVDDAPVGACGGILELRAGDTAMVEITTPKLDPAARIVFVPLAKLRRVG